MNSTLTPPAPPMATTPVPSPPRGFAPRAPETIEAAGLSRAFVEDHVLRLIYSKPQISGSQVAAACGMSLGAGIGSILDSLRRDHLVEIRGQRGIGEGGYAYVFTSKGTARAAEAPNICNAVVKHRTPWRYQPA